MSTVEPPAVPPKLSEVQGTGAVVSEAAEPATAAGAGATAGSERPVPPPLPSLYKKLLAAAAEAAPSPPPEDEDAAFAEVLAARRAAKEARDPTLRVIPQFFFRKQATPDESLHSVVKRVALRLRLHKLSREQLTDEDLKTIASALQGNVSPPRDGTDRINYDGFCIVKDAVSPKAAVYFTATNFLKFPRDEYDRISSKSFFQYICGNVGLAQTRIHLSSYDSVGDGHLREFDLENYVFELIPTLAPLKSLKENFIPFYVFTAVRKFLFFLDPKKTGRVPVNQVVGSRVMAELQALRSDKWSEASNQANWFSAGNALRVYSQYLELDTDMNGMLSKSELLQYGSGTLTQTFVDRVFQECLTYGGEMDFKTFLDFVLAMENRTSAASMQFLFRLLDINRQGYLDAFTINYFFRDVLRRMMQAGQEPINPLDVLSEIFDMVAPEDPARITFADLRRSKTGHTVLHILIDVQGFWQYDNREALQASSEPEEMF